MSSLSLPVENVFTLPALTEDSPLARMLPRPRESLLILLVFHVARARPVRNQPTAPSGYDWVENGSLYDCLHGKLPSNALALRAKAVDSLPVESDLRVISLGGHLEEYEFVYVVDGVAYLVGSPGGSCIDTGDLWISPSAPPVLDPNEYLTKLQTQLDGLPDRPIQRYRRFFFDLDRNTEETLLTHHLPGETGRLAKLGDVMWIVSEVRLFRRLQEHLEAPARCTPFYDSASFYDTIEEISTLFLRLMFEHFSTPHGVLDLDAFEDAFEMFANGELRLQLEDHLVWTAQPSSGAFFLFGEFALLAAECGIEPELWTKIANVMVRTQPLFCHLYAPSPALATPSLADYHACNFDEARRFTSLQKQALRAAFAGFDHDALCLAAAQHIATYAPGEFPALGLPLPGSRRILYRPADPPEGLPDYTIPYQPSRFPVPV